MRPTTRRRHLLRCAAALAASSLAAAVPPVAGARPLASGPPAAGMAKVTKPTWIRGVRITEYFPVPESWFTGRKVEVRGLSSKHRIDWFFSARGLSMEGEGIGLDGRIYHIDGLGRGGWVNKAGQSSCVCAGVYWRAGAYWRNRRGGVTFPLDAGGWSNGTGLSYVPLYGSSFKPGSSRNLQFYESIAVDPSLIPLGSRVYIPAYRSKNGTGWFWADDTGGAIGGRHVDIYRPPPRSPNDYGNTTTGARIYVVPPKAGSTRTRRRPSSTPTTTPPAVLR